jgi:hypothetical protein
MTRFRTRRMELGDEIAFNDAYNSLGAAPPRPIAEMRRIWHQGPGGPVKSWIVEADNDAGWRLIGHHGLCPVRFTLGSQDLLFAKTVSSFLLPEFHGRFVYLRFEQRCLAEAERDFDATYTLAGLAVRMRAALGYDTSVLELDFEQGLRAPGLLSRLLTRLAWRFPHAANLARPWRILPRRKSPLALTELESLAAPATPFFADFWDEARLSAGLAPRRDAADLAWRFWNMPGGLRRTLIHVWPCGARGYGIVNTSDGLYFTLEDIFLSAPRADLLAELLDAILAWCAEEGGLMLGFMTTADSQPAELLDVYRRKMGENLNFRHRGQHLSRRLTSLGRERLGPRWPPCNITAIAAVA